jgi:hypothetical protein
MWASSAALAVTPENRRELERLVRSGRTEQRIVLRARITLGAAEGKSNNALAKELTTSRPTVLDWRQRFADGGVKALYDDRPRGRSFSPLARAKEAEIIAATQTAPVQATQGSCRSMAKLHGISPASVQRIWHANDLKPHLVRTFKLSNDPKFIAKLEDVVGLYMNPPENALVFCIDEKIQIQALDRTQPGLPMKKGRAGTMTHDYKRNGTTTLFAALDVLKGVVIGRCMPRHRHQEFLKFLRVIDKGTPKHMDIHCIADNYAEPPLRRLVMATLIAAVTVQQLLHARDGATARPLSDAFDAEDRALLEALNRSVEGNTAKQRNPHPPGTLAYAAWTCGRLGGWTGYYGKPSPIVLLRGWQKFQQAKRLLVSIGHQDV